MFIKAKAWTYDREYDGSTGLTIKTEVKLLFASIVRDSDYVLCECAKIMQGGNADHVFGWRRGEDKRRYTASVCWIINF